MQVPESTQELLSHIPNYVTTFTGQVPAQREIDRFMANVEQHAR
ncbi:hypothetical protein [Salipiger sp. IMCC34102]|nr:hypothetical protein [Salipiger sp. IMCC34102]